MTKRETTTPAAEYAKISISMIVGVLLTLAVELWLLVDFGFIRLKDPKAGEKAVEAAYLDECYSMIAVNPQED